MESYASRAAIKICRATVMAMARLDIPGLMLYGGSIAPGHANGKDITIQDVFEGIGAHARGTIDDAGLEVLEAAACPGAGACGGQFTANTMAMACEFLGISPIGLSGVPALSPDKHAASRRAGELIMAAARNDLRPSKLITPVSIENAIASVAASGGSTECCSAFFAIAHEMGIPLSIDDFDRISSRTPLLCDLKPGGNYVANDYQAAGGSLSLAQRLLAAGLLHGECLNITGKTLAEEAESAKETLGQPVIRSLENPIKPTGGLVILKGNLAPEGSVVKVAGHKRLTHRGPARVFDTEQKAFEAVQSGSLKPNDVVVIRYDVVGDRQRPATSHRSDCRNGTRRERRTPHGRPFLRSYPRADGRTRCAGSRGWRAYRRCARRRHH